jgi:hypothetical protein
MKPVILILLFLLSSVAGAAQEQCVSASKASLALHKLRLEMSPAEVQNALGRELKIKVKKTGERTFFQNFIKKPSPPTLPNVRALYLRFFDGKLYQIEIFYENQSDAQTLESFTEYLSATMNLPLAWQTKQGRSEIKCPQFSLVADNVLNPRIEITDEEIRQKAKSKRQK